LKTESTDIEVSISDLNVSGEGGKTVGGLAIADSWMNDALEAFPRSWIPLPLTFP
jgi:hypothetical protein